MPIISGRPRAQSLPSDLSTVARGISAPRNAMASRVRGVRANATSIDPHGAPDRAGRRASAPDVQPHQFAEWSDTQARQSLFSVNPEKAQELHEAFSRASSFCAKTAIDSFAKIYDQLRSQSDLSDEARKFLTGLAQEYTDKILKDGLGEGTAFGAWTSDNKKLYSQREKLEQKLMDVVKEHCGQNFLGLGDAFLVREVVPYVLRHVESSLGRALDDHTAGSIMEMVDRAAMNAFKHLRTATAVVHDMHGASMNMLARDLHSVAMLPRMLRSVVAQELGRSEPEFPAPPPPPDDSLPPPPADDSLPPPPADDSLPPPPAGDGPTPRDTPAAPTAQTSPSTPGGVTINFGGINIDNSYTDNSMRDRHDHNRSWQTKRSEPTALARRLIARESSAQSVSIGTGESSAESSQPVSTRTTLSEQTQMKRSVSIDSGFGDEVDAAEATDAESATDALTTVEVDNEHQDVGTFGLQEPAQDVIIGAGASSAGTSTVATTPSDARRVLGLDTLKLQRGNLPRPSEAYLSSKMGQIVPAKELIRFVLNEIELDPSQPWTTPGRKEISDLRNRLKAQVDANFPSSGPAATQAEDIQLLRQLFADNRQLDKRRDHIKDFALRLIRHTGMPTDFRSNALVQIVLDSVAKKWDWRNADYFGQPTSMSSKPLGARTAKVFQFPASARSAAAAEQGTASPTEAPSREAFTQFGTERERSQSFDSSLGAEARSTLSREHESQPSLMEREVRSWAPLEPESTPRAGVERGITSPAESLSRAAFTQFGAPGLTSAQRSVSVDSGIDLEYDEDDSDLGIPDLDPLQDANVEAATKADLEPARQALLELGKLKLRRVPEPLPSQAYLGSKNGLIVPEKELLKFVLREIEPDLNQPWSTPGRKEVSEMRSDLRKYVDNRETSMSDTLAKHAPLLRRLLQEHPQLKDRRKPIREFALGIIRHAGKTPDFQSNALVNAVMSAVDTSWVPANTVSLSSGSQSNAVESS